MDVFTTILEKFDSPLWTYHVKVPLEISNKYITGNNRRVIIYFKPDEPIKCALMPDGSGSWFILINQTLRDHFRINLGDKVELNIEKDNSEYGMDMPDEFRELLSQEEEANFFFERLTPGKKRNLIYIVGKVKNSESRLRKSLAIVQHLKEFQGKLDFKILNQTIKYYNNL